MLIEHEHLRDQPLAVEAICYARRCRSLDDQAQRVDLLAVVKGGNGDRDGAESRDANPEKVRRTRDITATLPLQKMLAGGKCGDGCCEPLPFFRLK